MREDVVDGSGSIAEGLMTSGLLKGRCFEPMLETSGDEIIDKYNPNPCMSGAAGRFQGPPAHPRSGNVGPLYFAIAAVVAVAEMRRRPGLVQAIVAPSANASCIAPAGNFQASTFLGLLLLLDPRGRSRPCPISPR